MFYFLGKFHSARKVAAHKIAARNIFKNITLRDQKLPCGWQRFFSFFPYVIAIKIIKEKKKR